MSVIFVRDGAGTPPHASFAAKLQEKKNVKEKFSHESR